MRKYVKASVVAIINAIGFLGSVWLMSLIGEPNYLVMGAVYIATAVFLREIE